MRLQFVINIPITCLVFLFSVGVVINLHPDKSIFAAPDARKRTKAKYSWGSRVQIHDASEVSAGVSHYYIKVNEPEDDQALLVYSQIKKIFFEGIAEQQCIQNLRQDCVIHA